MLGEHFPDDWETLTTPIHEEVACLLLSYLQRTQKPGTFPCEPDSSL